MTGQYVYLDYAATTQVRAEVREVMIPFLTENFGNPSSAHRVGRAARVGLETARRKIAEALGAKPSNVVFTSGGTEADNLGVLGAALVARERGEPFRIAVSVVEHKAVLAAADAVVQLGGEAIMLPVDASGKVDLDAVDAALQRGVAVVSVMWVNNETGVMPNLADVAARCEAVGTSFHTDAVQAVGKIPCSLTDSPITLMTISGHKIGAPKGIGALILRDHRAVAPLIHGGGQQQGVRPGTENVAGAVGLGEAVVRAVADLDETSSRTRTLRDELETRLRAVMPDITVHGCSAVRAPHISCLSIPGTDGESLTMHLDLAGIACSSGSACSTGSVHASHVLAALKVPADLALGSLRFSFGRESTEDDVNRVVDELPGVVKKVRELAESLGP